MSGYGGYDGGGATQFGGGGFVPTPAPGSDTHDYGDKQKGGSKAPQTMRNVTVRQLLRDCNDSSDTNMVDQVDLSTFFIVGRIVNRVDTASCIKFKVDDGTGIIEVLHYVDDANELIASVAQEWVLNSYVRVCGMIRSVDQKKGMTAIRIRPVKDFNEVTYHNMQCVFQHLHLTKGAAPPMSGPGSGGMGFTPRPAAAPQAPASTGAMGGDKINVSGDKLHEVLVRIYNEHTQNSEEGLSVSAVVSMLADRGMSYPHQQVQEKVDFMNNEGLLYSTSDDQHHRSTSC